MEKGKGKIPLVGILMGSVSDKEVMKEVCVTLDRFSIPYEITISSAHRSPKKTSVYATNAEKKGIKVIIAGAGGAAHLAGIVASETILPVIGVPIDSSPLKGLDSLLSTVQMPRGIPVATMALGKAGAINAGILAAQILGLNSRDIKRRLKKYKIKLANEVEKQDKKLGDKD